MRYDIIGWTCAIIKWWKHKDDVPYDVNDQPEVTLPPTKINLNGCNYHSEEANSDQER